MKACVFVGQTGNPQLDNLMAAQAKGGAIEAAATLVWSGAAQTFAVERLYVDLPGDNRVTLIAKATGVDLATTGFALTEADLTKQSRSLFGILSSDDDRAGAAAV